VITSVRAQRDERVDACRAPRGQITRQQRRSRQHCDDSDVRYWIGPRDAGKHPTHESCHRECRRDADDDTSQREPHTVADNQPEDFVFAGAERQANADLANPLLDAVREDSIKSERGEEERDRREEGHHERREARLPGGGRNDLGHWPHVREWPGLEVVSLSVPPSWNVTSELNDPSEAFVSQLRSVTVTNHVPSIAFLEPERFEYANPTPPDISSAPARVTAAARRE
jgi:hypothetical protein